MPEKLLVSLGQSPPESARAVRERAAGLHFGGISKDDAREVCCTPSPMSEPFVKGEALWPNAATQPKLASECKCVSGTSCVLKRAIICT